MMTPRQQELFLFITTFVKEKGIAPSFEEMRKKLSLRSKSGVHRLMVSLEERGYIRRIPNRARAIEILRYPNDMVGTFGQETAAEIPFLGRITAGEPQEMLAEPGETFTVPRHLTTKNPCYALRVRGDSMKDKGIFDGDIAIIEDINETTDGAIVAALVDGEETTLKILRRKGQKIVLEPANDRYESRIFDADKVQIQGQLISLIRRYGNHF